MTEREERPHYMEKLLEQLGWNQGTRIPLADPENQVLEDLLISRQNEIQRLREDLILQKQKRDDLDKYKANVHNEYQENTRLLFAHKNQMEQEVKLRQLATNEADRVDRDIVDCNKKSKELCGRLDRFQGSIAKLLKKADTLKTEVCGERGALQEWRAALERSSGDITAIEQFTKQDISKAKELEYKRQQLKVEHDKMHERLTQLMSNLAAEERGCERISVQVMEGMEQRKQMMMMWSAAIENLRQRDTDIRHIREDYAILEEEANRIAEQCREQQAFCDQQAGNNAEAERENMAFTARIGHMRVAQQHLMEANVTLDSEAKSLQRELSNTQSRLESLHTENKRIMAEQQRKDKALTEVNQKINELKAKFADSLDRTKSSERRAKDLEQILNDEERYASNLTKNQQRAIHCSFVQQQKLLALKNEEKLFRMQLRASNAILAKMDIKEMDFEKKYQGLKEALYALCYQVETYGARVLHMEGALAEREADAELVKKENRLKDVLALHASRVALLERHSARLHEDMRRLARELELKGEQHEDLQNRLKTSMLTVSGGDKELTKQRAQWRAERVEEALLKLRTAHAARALVGFENTAFSLDKQRLHLESAMKERLIEIGARRDMYSVQKRALFDECGHLRAQIREREQRVEQLMKRYDIFIASLGKEDSGQQLSVTFFKIKFAAERAELREKGAALDADIGRRERDVSALEATMRVVAAAHSHFLHHISPLTEDTPEIDELNNLTKQYYAARDELKELCAKIDELEERVTDIGSRHQLLTDKYKQLTARQYEAEMDLEGARERVARQETHLQNANETVKHNAKRAKKLIDDVDDWRLFQMSLRVRDCAEAAHNAVHALHEACASPHEARARLGALLAVTDLRTHMSRNQRRLLTFVDRVVRNSVSSLKDVALEIEDSVFSTSSESVHSGASHTSGFTRRLVSFRKTLASRIQEPMLLEEIPEQAHRSTVSLRVVTLGLEESVPNNAAKSTTRSSRSRTIK